MLKDKKGVIGFQHSVLAPIIQDDKTGYKTGEAILIPHAAEMSKSEKSSESEVYADGILYAYIKNVAGLGIAVKYRELGLELAGKIGGGEYDAADKQLEMDYSENNDPYLFGYIEPIIDGKTFRTVQILSTELNSIDMIGTPKTKENNITVQDMTIELTAKKPQLSGQRPIRFRIHESEEAAIAYIKAPLIIGVPAQG